MDQPSLRCIICILIFSSAMSGFSQNQKDNSKASHSFGLQLGIESNIYLDELVSPLMYKGIGWQTGLNYKSQKRNSRFDISLQYAAVQDKSKYHNERVLYITPSEPINNETILALKELPQPLPHIGIRIAYSKSITRGEKAIHFFLGGSICSNLRIPSTSNVIFSPVMVTELNVFASADIQIKPKLNLSLGLELPILANLVRLPYAISTVKPNTGIVKSTFENNKMVSWNKYQSAGTFMDIKYNISKNLEAQLCVQFYYLHYNEPKEIHFLQRRISTGINYSF